MAEFVKVARADQLPDPGKLVLEVADRLVVLVRTGGQFYCIDDICTHDGGPLGDGELCGHELACPRHGAKFDVRTGRVLSMPATEDTAAHEVRVQDGDVYVKLAE